MFKLYVLLCTIIQLLYGSRSAAAPQNRPCRISFSCDHFCIGHENLAVIIALRLNASVPAGKGLIRNRVMRAISPIRAL